MHSVVGIHSNILVDTRTLDFPFIYVPQRELFPVSQDHLMGIFITDSTFILQCTMLTFTFYLSTPLLSNRPGTLHVDCHFCSKNRR